MEGKTDMFWAQGDFGYIKQEVDSMMDLCTPNTKLTEVNKFLVSRLVNIINQTLNVVVSRAINNLTKLKGKNKFLNFNVRVRRG